MTESKTPPSQLPDQKSRNSLSLPATTPLMGSDEVKNSAKQGKLNESQGDMLAIQQLELLRMTQKEVDYYTKLSWPMCIKEWNEQRADKRISSQTYDVRLLWKQVASNK